MVLRYKLLVEDRIMRVPYRRSFKGSRTNRGFRDLRGRPEQAARITEAQPSNELRLLLHEGARLNSRLFTIGCDLGSHTEDRLRHRNVAGGYIQIAMRKYAHATPDHYLQEANRISEEVRKSSKSYLWRITYLLNRCRFRLGRDPETDAPSLLIHFWALSKTHEGAVHSRETLIAHLRTTLFEEAASSG